MSGTLWILDENGALDTIMVRTGLTDGQRTVVMGDRLEEGMEVIAAVTSSDAEGAANPFQPGQSQGQSGPGFGPRGAF